MELDQISKIYELNKSYLFKRFSINYENIIY